MAKQREPEGKFVGGCAKHEVRGPVRTKSSAATKDVHGHMKRMHAKGDSTGGYIERRG